MVGDSARSANGSTYYWYTCQNVKKTPRTCQKRRVNKDSIEQAVLQILNDEILTDEFIERAASAAVEYEKHYDNNSEVDALRAQLAAVESKIRNVSNAIATGTVTVTLPAMLADFEKQREELENAIARKTVGMREFNRDAVVAYLKEIKALSHKNAGSQRQIINACIKSVYLFDTEKKDEQRIVINMNLFDDTAEINHDAVVRLVTVKLGGGCINRTIIDGRRLLIVRNIKMRPGDKSGRDTFRTEELIRMG